MARKQRGHGGALLSRLLLHPKHLGHRHAEHNLKATNRNTGCCDVCEGWPRRARSVCLIATAHPVGRQATGPPNATGAPHLWRPMSRRRTGTHPRRNRTRPTWLGCSPPRCRIPLRRCRCSPFVRRLPPPPPSTSPSSLARTTRPSAATQPSQSAHSAHPPSVRPSPTTTTAARARVSATLARRASARNPTRPPPLDRTAEKRMTSASRPWKPSTVATVAAAVAAAPRRDRDSARACAA